MTQPPPPDLNYAGVVELVEAASPQPVVDALSGDKPSQESSPDACADLGPSDAEASGADPKIVADCAKLDHSDTDNGKRLINHFGRDLVVMAQGGVPGGDYIAWDGKRWDLDNGPAMAAMLAQKVGGRIAQEAEFLDFTPPELDAVKAEEAFPDKDDSAAAKAARTAADGARKSLQTRKTARWRFGVSSKNDARIKNMLTAAAPHLRNVATPHMSGNGFPKIEGTDNGIWRRMLVVHWSVTVPAEERREFDEFVDELMTEAPGILNWLIAGAMDFLANGLVVAPAIANATEAYREDMDPIGRFVAQCVEADPGKKVPAREMFRAYEVFCRLSWGRWRRDRGIASG